MKKDILLLILIVTLSRLPFLFYGYGVEEDSWGLVLNAWEMREEGRYIHSRLPGHPVQEAVYYLICDAPPFVYNSLSVFFGVLSLVWFYLLLDHIRFRKPLIASIAFSFVPVFFINTVSTIDYVWALAFITGSVYMAVRSRYALAGILLGLAFGTRITSVLMLLPILWLILQRKEIRPLKSVFTFLIWFAVFSVASYLVPIREYGLSIFSTYSLPYPPALKVMYRFSFGVFGLAGVMAILTVLLVKLFRRRERQVLPGIFMKNKLWIGFSLITVGAHLLLFLAYPHKSAFMLPAVPFVILLFGYLATGSHLPAILYTGLIAGSFLFGIDLSDPYRGSSSSWMAIHKHVAGQTLFLDPLRGPVFNDLSRRKTKIRFTEKVMSRLGEFDEPTVIISGWWYNQVLTEMKRRDIQSEVLILDHVSEELLHTYYRYGFDLYYLPEINRINDNRYGGKFTAMDAKPLFPN